MLEAILFYFLAACAVAAAIAAITRINPLMSAIWLVAALLALAGLYATLSAPLVAAIQVIIAAGAVMVLILFVIMLTNLGPGGRRPHAIRFGKILGAMAAAYLAIVMILAVAIPPFVSPPESGGYYESPLTLGGFILGRYAAAFELAGVMLLVAAVAVVSIGKWGEVRASESEEDAEERI
ncbi:MAG: NADH-quinone oxidoreductase subunit J [bacterium]